MPDLIGLNEVKVYLYSELDEETFLDYLTSLTDLKAGNNIFLSEKEQNEFYYNNIYYGYKPLQKD
ncbi:MAG: hypothetical protein R2777_10745, partial [Chitinophagales bacterium]